MAKTKEKHDVNELRELSKDELLARAAERRKTLFELKSKHSTGVLDSTADLGKIRRDIARCLTVAREKERATATAPQGAPRVEAASPRGSHLAGKKE
jgi:large subunit ribosomal protein L29